MLKVLIIIGAVATATNVVAGEVECHCGSVNPARNTVVFAEDPLVPPGLGYISEVEELNVAATPDGGCDIMNSFPDAPAQVPTYTYQGLEILLLRWEYLDGSYDWVTIEEAQHRAYAVCTGDTEFLGM